MLKKKFEITYNAKIAKNIYKMILSGNTEEIKAGQFINIQIEGLYLRRPISVCDCEDGLVTIIYKTVGKGTEKMSEMVTGEVLDILTGLGNGYDLSKSGNSPLLIGGGVGVPPLYKLAKELIKQNKDVSVVLGFNTADEVFYEEEFKSIGTKVYVATADGSYGTKGFVTDVIKNIRDYSYTYSCGPEPMLKAVFNATKVSGQFSFEERMGCGFGACMGCSCKTKYENKRICKDGPVLEKEEIIW